MLKIAKNKPHPYEPLEMPLDYDPTINRFWGEKSKKLKGNLLSIYGDATGNHGEVKGVYGVIGDISKITGPLDNICGLIARNLYGEIHPELKGNITAISGCITGIYGDISRITGDVTLLEGDATDERGLTSSIIRKLKTK
jgi:hypothetical protein